MTAITNIVRYRATLLAYSVIVNEAQLKESTANNLSIRLLRCTRNDGNYQHA